MIETETIQAITTVGFPIVACAYMALRFESIIKANTEAINSLRDIVLSLKK